MKSVLKPVLFAAVLATAGFSAFSQGPGMGEPCTMMGAGGAMHEGMDGAHRMGKMDSAKMQAYMEQRHAKLKAQLKLTAAQEGAWTTYMASMKPPAQGMTPRLDRAELAKLPTPERIDKMKALRSQHMADMTATMDQRGEAIKAFYATLTPEQQKVFDANMLSMHAGEGRKGGWHDGKGPAAPVSQ